MQEQRDRRRSLQAHVLTLIEDQLELLSEVSALTRSRQSNPLGVADTLDRSLSLIRLNMDTLKTLAECEAHEHKEADKLTAPLPISGLRFYSDHQKHHSELRVAIEYGGEWHDIIVEPVTGGVVSNIWEPLGMRMLIAERTNSAATQEAPHVDL